MKKGIERGLIAFLFTLVLVMFSLAQRDSRRLGRLYQTAASVQKKTPVQLVQSSPLMHKSPALQ